MEKQRLARGMGASPGIATGAIVFQSDDAVMLAKQGTPVILVRIDTTAEDVPGMQVAAGIMTTRGGITGDAAIVSRTLGKPCIASCSEVHIDYANRKLTVWPSKNGGSEDVVLKQGDVITINGATGELWKD